MSADIIPNVLEQLQLGLVARFKNIKARPQEQQGRRTCCCNGINFVDARLAGSISLAFDAIAVHAALCCHPGHTLVGVVGALGSRKGGCVGRSNSRVDCLLVVNCLSVQRPSVGRGIDLQHSTEPLFIEVHKFSCVQNDFYCQSFPARQHEAGLRCVTQNCRRIFACMHAFVKNARTKSTSGEPLSSAPLLSTPLNCMHQRRETTTAKHAF
jgi:hypothetical protein